MRIGELLKTVCSVNPTEPLLLLYEITLVFVSFVYGDFILYKILDEGTTHRKVRDVIRLRKKKRGVLVSVQ